jgi:hypothetical protein
MTPKDSLWLFIWELVATIGIIVVIFGIIGEGSELLAKWAIKRKYKRLQKGIDDGARWFLAVLLKYIRPRILEVETFAFALVVIGLMAEFWGGHKSQEILGRNNSELNNKTARLVTDNLVLRSNVAVLEAAAQWRTITPQQENIITNFANANSALWAKWHMTNEDKVIVLAEISDDEAIWYGNRIVYVLKECGFNASLSESIATFEDRSKNNAPFIGLAYFVKYRTATNNMTTLMGNAGAISGLLQGAGIMPDDWELDTNLPTDGDIGISVGHKPEK